MLLCTTWEVSEELFPALWGIWFQRPIQAGNTSSNQRRFNFHLPNKSSLCEEPPLLSKKVLERHSPKSLPWAYPAIWAVSQRSDVKSPVQTRSCWEKKIPNNPKPCPCTLLGTSHLWKIFLASVGILHYMISINNCVLLFLTNSLVFFFGIRKLKLLLGIPPMNAGSQWGTMCLGCLWSQDFYVHRHTRVHAHSGKKQMNIRLTEFCS